MTYLELVNDILTRLRESTVSTVSQTAYSRLIGKLVNDSKKRVEDAYNWSALNTTIVVPTVAGTYNYSILGSGQRFKVISIFNDTSDYDLLNISAHNQQRLRYTGTQSNAQPTYYTFNGVDASGDTKVDLYPTPDGIYSIRFNFIVPQATLSADATVLLIPSEPVIHGAYALALAERGEDQGLATSEAANIYRSTMADAIAIEATRHCENDCWGAV